MSKDKTLEQKKRLLSKVDKGWSYYNYVIAWSVIGEFFATGLMSGKLVQFAFAVYSADFDMAWKLADEIGLIEKLSDAGIHFFNGDISKDSSNAKIIFGIFFDCARIIMGYYYGKNQTTKIPAGLNYLDLGGNHPFNLVVNGIRAAVKYFGFFSSSENEICASPQVVPEGKREELSFN